MNCAIPRHAARLTINLAMSMCFIGSRQSSRQRRLCGKTVFADFIVRACADSRQAIPLMASPCRSIVFLRRDSHLDAFPLTLNRDGNWLSFGLRKERGPFGYG